MQTIAVVGHVTKDIIEINGARKEKIGGTAFYSGITLAKLGVKTKIFTKLAEKDKDLLKELRHRNISLFPYFCKSTTRFRNVYRGESREQFVDSVAEPFSVRDIKGIEGCSIVHLGTLTGKDIPLAILKHLKSLGIAVSLDVQGYLRRIRNKRVSLWNWKGCEEFPKYADIIKADTSEAAILAGVSGPKAAEVIASYGPREVVITEGRKGSLVYSENKCFRIPAVKPPAIKDVTGAGDTFMAAYLAKRMATDDLRECGMFAAACAAKRIAGLF